MRNKIIAIDGPAGAGKSTVARLVAARLGYLYIDSGAMYRAITKKAMDLQIPFDDWVALTNLANDTDIKLVNKKGETIVYTDGDDVTEAIRAPEVSQNVSVVAIVPGVRQRMVELQRNMAKYGGVVMDGRDICIHVLPWADHKFFLTASVEERAIRRCRELEAKGFAINLDEVKKDICRRDLMDSQREIAPLVQALDAQLIDSTGLTIEEVIEKILDEHKREV